MASSVLPSLLADGSAGTLGRIASEFHVEWPMLIAQIINFLIVAFLLHRFAFRPLMTTLAQRSSRIADGLQYAEEMKSQLAKTEVLRNRELKEASQRAAAIVGEAQKSAADLATAKRAELAQHLARMRVQEQERLQQEYESMLDAAQSHLRGEAVSLATALLQSELTEETRDQLGRRMLQKMVDGGI